MKTVVRGLGIITPYGNNPDIVFEKELERKHRITGFELPFHPSKLRRINKFDKILLAAAIGALNYHKEEREPEDLEQCGLILTTSYGSLQTNMEYTRSIIQNQEASPFLFVNTISNAPLGNISILLGLKGVSSMLMGSNVLLMGMRYLAQKKARYVLAGGGDEYHAEIGENSSCSSHMGGNLSEGAAVLLLEDAEDDKTENGDIFISSTDQRLPQSLYVNDWSGDERMAKLFGREKNLSLSDVDAVFYAFNRQETFFVEEFKLLGRQLEINKIPVITLGEVLGDFMGGSSVIAHAFAIHCMKNNRLPADENYYYRKADKDVNLNTVLVIGYEKGGNIVSSILTKKG